MKKFVFFLPVSSSGSSSGNSSSLQQLDKWWKQKYRQQGPSTYCTHMVPPHQTLRDTWCIDMASIVKLSVRYVHLGEVEVEVAIEPVQNFLAT